MLTTNNNAIVDEGQLKQFTVKAVAELNANLPGGAGTTLNEMVNTWSNQYYANGYNSTTHPPADYQAMNAGQLKYIGHEVYARLIATDYASVYPSWLTGTNTADYHAVTIGQVKSVFNFDLTLPQLPANITESVGNTQVTFTWSDPATGLSGYNVQTSTDGGVTWTNVNSSLITATTYTVTGLTALDNYLFRIAAVNSAGQSAAPSISIGTAPATPVLSVGSTLSLVQFNVTVTEATSGATIYYTLDGSTPTTSSATVTSGGTITISKSETLQAIAIATGYSPSAVASATYQVTGQVASGQLHSIALKGDGTVWAFGANNVYQIGDNTFTDRHNPVKITSLSGITEVAAGLWHSLALSGDGTVWAWGSNSNGQLSNATSAWATGVPVHIGSGTLSGIIAVSAGGYHSLALKSDGTVWAWGLNSSGQLGNNSTTQSATPVEVTIVGGGALSSVVAIAAGAYHNLALTSNGAVYAWGLGTSGQLGNSSSSSSSYAVAVTGLGSGSGVTQIDAAGYSSFVVKSGTIYSWGLNNAGQLGDGTTTQHATPTTTGINNVSSVCAGQYHTLAIKNDGTALAFGDNTYGELGNDTLAATLTPVAMSGITNAVSLGAGVYDSLVIKGDGTLWVAGYNSNGQLGDGATSQRSDAAQVLGLSAITAVSASGLGTNALGLKSDGTVWSFGNNGQGQLGDGTVLQHTSPQQVPGLSAKAVYAGGYYSVALKNDNTLVAWGDNTRGELGDGTMTQRNSPVPVGSLTSVSSVSAGPYHCEAVSGGTVWSWGVNNTGQIGNGNLITQKTPVQIGSFTNVAGVVATYDFNLALKNDGKVWAWGANANGELGDGTTTQRTTPVNVLTAVSTPLSSIDVIAAGQSFYDYSLALNKTAGTVWAWGINTYGELGNGNTTQQTYAVQVGGSGFTGVTAISAGVTYNLALKSDGTVWGWGSNIGGGLGNGNAAQQTSPVEVKTIASGHPALTNIVAISASGDHSIALQNDGTNPPAVWAWGSWNGSSSTYAVQITGLSGVTAIAGGLDFSLALKQDGTLQSWGNSAFDELGTGACYSLPFAIAGYNLLSGVPTPTVSISTPANNASVVLGQTQTFTASASESGGSISAVQYYIDSTLIGQSTTGSPYNVSWTPPTWGNFNFTAIATDANGNTSLHSTPVTVQVPYSYSALPQITSAAAVTTAANVAFGYTITATGSPTSFGATGLPAGLGVSTTTGIISGTPTTPGLANVTLAATNGAGTATAFVVIDVEAATDVPVINSAGTAETTFGSNFAYLITASNSPTLFNVSNLVSGLSLNSYTGVISGTAATAGTYTMGLTATNGAGTSGSVPLVLNVDGLPTGYGSPPTLSLANQTGTMGTSFNYTFSTTGTIVSYDAVSLPAGLTLNTSGVITGTPTAAGIYNAIISVSNLGGTTSGTLTFTINSIVPVITSSTSVTAPVDVDFLYAITALNGPISYSATGLPSGLSVDTNTGLITGTPDTIGSYTSTLGAANSAGSASAVNLLLTVSNAPVITSDTTTPLSVNIGSTFRYSVTANDSPTSFAATGLPAGLIINTSTGIIAGYPSAVGTYTMGLSAVTPVGTTPTANLTLSVGLPGLAIPTITNPPVIYVTQNASISYPIVATNTPASFTATPLPSGLSFSTSTGIISGTISSVSTPLINLTATNALGSGHASLVIAVKSSGSAHTVTTKFQAGLSPFPGYQTGSATIESDPDMPNLSDISLSGLHAGSSGDGMIGYGIIDRGLLSFDLSTLPSDASFWSSGNTLTLHAAVLVSGSGSTTISFYPTISFVPGISTWTTNYQAASGSPWGSYTLSSSGSSVTPISGTNLQSAFGSASMLDLMLLDSSSETDPTGTEGFGLFSDESDSTPGNHPLLTLTYTTLAPPVILPSTTYINSGTAYTYTFSPINCESGATFTGSMAPSGSGLSLSTAGIISGTPTTAGTYTLSASTSNGNGMGTGVLQFIVGSSPTFTGSGTVTMAPIEGVAFGSTGVSDVTNSPHSPATYSIYSGSLPSGMFFDPQTGTIYGIPSSGTSGTYSVEITASNAFGTSGTPETVTITVGSAIPSSVALTETVGTGFTYNVMSGDGFTNFAATNLPSGLSLSTAGVLSGTPVTANVVPVSVTALTAGASTVRQTVTLTINANSADTTINFQSGEYPTTSYTADAVKIVSDSANPGYAGQNYNGGSYLPVGRYSTTGIERGLLSFDLSAIPAGAIITSASLVLNGSSSNSSGALVQIEVHQMSQSFDATTATWTLDNLDEADSYASLLINPSTVSGAQVFNGTAAFTQAVQETQLAGGSSKLYLTLVAPSVEASGSYADYVGFVINNTSTPTQNPKLVVTYTMAPVTDAPVITSPSVATGTVNNSFTYTITATNRPTSFGKTGTLPSGLTGFNSTTGVLSGTPTTVGSYVINVAATNSINTGNQDVTLNIDSVNQTDTLIKSSGDNQVGQYGTYLTYPLLVTAKKSGSGLGNTLVTFTVNLDQGGLAATSGSMTTSKSLTVLTSNVAGHVGEATVYLQLPPTLGTMTVTATAGTATPVTFTETSIATSGQSSNFPVLSIFSGGGQSDAANTPLGSPVVIQAVDALGQPFASLPLALYVVQGGGGIALSYDHTGASYSGYSSGSPLSATTDSQGLATIYLKLGPGGSSGALTQVKCVATSGPDQSTIYFTGIIQTTTSSTAAAGGNGIWSTDPPGTGPSTVSLDPPTGLKITPDTDDLSSITLSWQAGGSSVGSYYIERQVSSEGWSYVATTSGLSYPDSGLLADQRYEYRVSSIISGGTLRSSPSSVASYDFNPVYFSFQTYTYKLPGYEANLGEQYSGQTPVGKKNEDPPDDNDPQWTDWGAPYLSYGDGHGYAAVAANLPDSSPGRSPEVTADNPERDVTNVRYKWYHYPAASGTQFKWRIVYLPSIGVLGYTGYVSDPSQQTQIVEQDSATLSGNDVETSTYVYDPNPSPDQYGLYMIVTDPFLGVTDSNGDAGLDDHEKHTVGAQVSLDANGGAAFNPAIDNSYYSSSLFPNSYYTLTFSGNTSYFKVEDNGSPINSGQRYDIPDYDDDNFTVVANTGNGPIPDGASITLVLHVYDQGGNSLGQDTARFFIHNPPDPRNYSFPIDEASGARYRKIALNGLPMPDEKPQQSGETDQEKEETYIDALTVGLRHSTTDVYLPVSGSDFAVSARRDFRPETWNIRSGLRPHEEPDRPFGSCWSSNLAANIRFVANNDPKRTSPDQTIVTDETGAVHTFILWYDSTGKEEYFPMPTSRNEQQTPNLETLTVGGTTAPRTYIFKRKYGSTLLFQDVPVGLATGGDLVIKNDRAQGSQYVTTNHYARLKQATDRLGNVLNYSYVGGNTLIPATISVANQPDIKISIKQQPISDLIGGSGTQSVITAIWDANNRKTTYAYSSFNAATGNDGSTNHYGDPHGFVLTSVTAPDGAVTNYSYNAASELATTPGEPTNTYWYADLASITDPLGHTYSFTYNFDHSKYSLINNAVTNGYYAQLGSPRTVSTVVLPGGQGTTLFNNSATHVEVVANTGGGGSIVKGSPTLVVTDADANATGSGFTRTYNFGSPVVVPMPNIPGPGGLGTSFTQIVAYTELDIQYGPKTSSPVGSMEKFQFNIDAGMALSSITDLSGNTTTFDHTDAWTAGSDYQAFKNLVLSGVTLNGYYNDPTKQTDALSNSKTFTYDSATRIMTDVVDENANDTSAAGGSKTHYDIDGLGRRTTEIIKDRSGHPFQETDFTYGNSRYPGFMTQKQVKHLSGTGLSDPSWLTTNDPNGLITQYVPDGNGRVAREIVDPSGLNLVTTYTYDANGNKLTSTDPLSRTTWFSYDIRNRLITVTFADGGQKQLVYDARGNKVIEYDENGIATLYQYDSLNRLVKQVRDMNGNGGYNATTNTLTGVNSGTDLITQYCYNKVNSKLTTTDPMNGVTTMTYDNLQRVTTITDALNNVTQFQYGANSGGNAFDASSFKPTHIIDPRKFATDITYDKLYRPLSKAVQYQVGVSPSITSTQYDDVGNPLAVTDPLGNQTTNAYDPLNRLTKTTYADNTSANGSFIQYFYTSTGLKYETLVKNGDNSTTHTHEQVTQVQYDNAGRPTLVTEPSDTFYGDDNSTHTGSPVTTSIYDGAGNVTEITKLIDSNSSRTETWDYAYDGRNRKVAELGPPVLDSELVSGTYGTSVRPTVTTAYDQVGNVLSKTDARDNTTNMLYDAANRVTDVNAPIPVSGGSTHPNTHTTYDLNGNVLTVRDPNTHTTTNTYDKLNRLLSTLDPVGIRVCYEYDAVGNRIHVVDGNVHTTVFDYDGLNRNTRITDAAGKSTQFKYDALNKVQRIDAIGQVTNYSYNSRNRLKEVNYASTATTINSTRDYVYDNVGNLKTVTEATKSAANVTYTYNLLNRLTSEVSGGVTTAYTYDLAGNRRQTVYASTSGSPHTLVSTYDALNRLSALAESGTRTSNYYYDLNGSIVKKTLQNGDIESETFDTLNRGLSLNGTKTGGMLYSYTYDYDLASNVVTVAETYTSGLSNRVVTNAYYDDNTLHTETVTGSAPNSVATYTYDSANNRTAKVITGTGATSYSYTYNSLNQLTGYGNGTQSVALVYDANGNRYTRTISSNVDTYGYDFDNRLVSLAKYTSGGTGSYVYQYDYRTRRITRDESAISGGTLTHVIFSGGTSVQEYDGTNTTPTVEYIRGSDYGGGVGGILYTLRTVGGTLTPSYTHENKRGDVIAKTDGSGASTYQAQYAGFGDQTATTGSTSDRQKSNSKDTDPTNLVDEGFRYRDLDTGMFINRDPAGFVDGPNLYTYVVQNPWTSFDPEGLTAMDRVQGYADEITNGVVIDGLNGLKDIALPGISFAIPNIPHISNRDSATDKGDYDQGAKGGRVGAVAALVVPGVGEEQLEAKGEQLLVNEGKKIEQDAAKKITEAPKPKESAPPGGQSAEEVKGNPHAPGDVPDQYPVVKGGVTAPPAPGTEFSAAAGHDTIDAGKGVPHNQIQETTAGEIRANGGKVDVAPEPTRTGEINYRHVNVTEGGDKTTFSAPKPKPPPPPPTQ